MEAPRFDRTFGTPPAPLSQDERNQRIRQFSKFRQQEWLTRDPGTCGLNLLYDTARRMREADMYGSKAQTAAALLELDDRVTGKDYLVEAMTYVLPDDTRTPEGVISMLTWHRFGRDEFEPRLDIVFERHMARLAGAAGILSQWAEAAEDLAARKAGRAA